MSEEVSSQLKPVFKMSTESLSSWWRHLPKFLMLYVWGILYMAIPGIILFALHLALMALAMSSAVGVGIIVLRIVMIVLAFIATLFLAYYFIRLVISFFLLIKYDYKGDELKIFKDSRHYFWSYFWLKLLVLILVTLWSLLLVIPGLIFMVFYAMAIYVFFWEGKKGMEAIKRSKRLVKNHWWAVTGRLLFMLAAIYLFELIIIVLPLHWLGNLTVIGIIWTMIATLIIYIVIPVILIFMYKLYRSLAKIYKPKHIK